MIFDQVKSNEPPLQCWKCEITVQSADKNGVFLDDCRGEFDFTQHRKEECDGKCWKSVDLIDTKRYENNSQIGLLLKHINQSKRKSSRRCFTANELVRASEMGVNTSDGCQQVKKDDTKMKEMSATSGVNARSPAAIYSCLIRNNSDAEIDVQIKFAGIEDHHTEIADIELAKGEEERIDEKEFQHGESDGKYHKTVESIRVRRYDGSTMELTKPFDGVTSPKKDWIFEIDNVSIKSVDPNKK
ncbi:unnamed protein product [Adineta steineri]|uniref:Uncharacterized protein n=1 Tax=Adineta steineri TaxID=433720 RepID=A0A819CLC6_9BILA|nr:unnamed protein product [Adineta steineri]CAF3820846.1 unnamed protein product [Adineta steineri]